MKAALAALAPFAAFPAGAACFCLKCATGVWQSFQPVSGSMKPALEPGACVIVEKGAPVDRGSILAFRHRATPETVMLKRLIGLPGDVIKMQAGQVILNDVAVAQAPIAPYDQRSAPEGPQGTRPRCASAVPDGQICPIARLTETLPNGLSYGILTVESDGILDTSGLFTVPPGSVFVLGDNRDNSADSRIDMASGGLGFIPAANILGPVVEIANP